MGLLDFIKDAGHEIIGDQQGREADTIKHQIERAVGSNVQNLGVQFSGGVVTLSGTAKSAAAKERAALVAGNVRGVHRVDDGGLRVEGAAAPATVNAPMAKNPSAKTDARYHTVQKGETLSAIAQQHYGDAGKWRELFEANHGVIDDPDKIFPGQQIRIPNDLKA